MPRPGSLGSEGRARNKPLAQLVLLLYEKQSQPLGKKMTQRTRTILYRLILALATVSCVAVLYGCGGGDAQNTYTVSAKVSGLSGSGLILRLGGGGALAVMADGTYTFATPLASGMSYQVSLKTQPSLPRQICSVIDGSGTIGTADVSGVAVTCITSARLTTLYSFTGGSDGYGTTQGNGLGKHNSGTVYRISPSGAESVIYSWLRSNVGDFPLHSFGVGPSDGQNPSGALVLTSDDNFYRTTLAGGTPNANCRASNGCRTFYRITPSGTEAVLYSFGTNASDCIGRAGHCCRPATEICRG